MSQAEKHANGTEILICLTRTQDDTCQYLLVIGGSFINPLFEDKHVHQENGQAGASVDNATFDIRPGLFVGTKLEDIVNKPALYVERQHPLITEQCFRTTKLKHVNSKAVKGLDQSIFTTVTLFVINRSSSSTLPPLDGDTLCEEPAAWVRASAHLQ